MCISIISYNVAIYKQVHIQYMYLCCNGGYKLYIPGISVAMSVANKELLHVLKFVTSLVKFLCTRAIETLCTIPTYIFSSSSSCTARYLFNCFIITNSASKANLK